MLNELHSLLCGRIRTTFVVRVTAEKKSLLLFLILPDESDEGAIRNNTIYG
jgi:hypothetical protein